MHPVTDTSRASLTETEPASLTGALNIAITTTLAILLFAGVDEKLVAALTLAAGAWIGVATAWLRSRVRPAATSVDVADVALTHQDVDELKNAGF